MDLHFIYASGKPARQIQVDAVLDSISDHVLSDGDVEKALQRVFRFGTEEDFGLLDILDRLREEIQHSDQLDFDADQHSLDVEAGASERTVDDAIAMREALRQVESLDDLQGLDPEMMNRALTNEERDWVEKWSDMTGQLIESGLVTMSGPRLVLTAKAIRQIGSKLLQHIFLPPEQRGRGSHLIHQPGLHGEPGEDTSMWEWGKPMDLNIGRTLANSLRRPRIGDQLDVGIEDFEVFDRESGAAVHTVLLTDMSRSMFDSGAWDAAKRAAIALNTLVSSHRHHDHLDLVGFSGDSRELTIEELPLLTWDQFSHGTNLHAGLHVAGMLFSRRHLVNRQIVIITDGEPTAYMDGPNPVFEHPVTERTLNSTLLAGRRLSRQGVAFTTICIGDEEFTPEFAQTLSRVVSGRMILLPIDALGTFIVRDIIRGTSLAVN